MRRLLVAFITLASLAVAAAAWGSEGHAAAATKVTSAQARAIATLKQVPFKDPFGKGVIPRPGPLAPLGKLIVPRALALAPFRFLVPGPTTCYVGASQCSLKPCIQFVGPAQAASAAPGIDYPIQEQVQPLPRTLTNGPCKSLPRGPEPVLALRAVPAAATPVSLAQHQQLVRSR